LRPRKMETPDFLGLNVFLYNLTLEI